MKGSPVGCQLLFCLCRKGSMIALNLRLLDLNQVSLNSPYLVPPPPWMCISPTIRPCQAPQHQVAQWTSTRRLPLSGSSTQPVSRMVQSMAPPFSPPCFHPQAWRSSGVCSHRNLRLRRRMVPVTSVPVLQNRWRQLSDHLSFCLWSLSSDPPFHWNQTSFF